jgi:sugar phosphate isomerase/epimerase
MHLGVMEHIIAADDEAATFARARRLGLAGVEIELTRAQLRAPSAPRLAALRAARAASGLAVPSLALGEHNAGGVASRDEATAAAAREDIRQAIDWAAALGASVILVPFFFKGDLQDESDVARAVAAFRALCPVAEARGIALCYEGTLNAAAIRRMADMVGSPAFGCYFDLANAVWRGMDTATEIRALGPLVRQVHVKDTRVGPGDVPPGQGLVDYAASAAALRAIGYDGWLVLETPAAPEPLIARDISFTRRVFPQIAWERPWPRFGAFSYGFGRGAIDRLIATFAELGLTAVQLGDGPLADALDDPEAVRAALDAAGLEVAAIAGYRNLVAPDAQQRRVNLDFLARCLEIAPRLGAPVVATETGTLNPESDWSPSPENWSATAWQAVDAALDELLPVAERSGAILALEGYVNNVLRTPGQVLGLFERYPTPHLQLVLDPYNYLSHDLLPAAERLTVAFLQRFEPHFVLAHLKDVAASGAEHDTPEFGTGVFPQRRYLEFLRDARPDLPLILEHLPLAHIPAAIRRVRRVAGAARGSKIADRG